MPSPLPGQVPPQPFCGTLADPEHPHGVVSSFGSNKETSQRPRETRAGFWLYGRRVEANLLSAWLQVLGAKSQPGQGLRALGMSPAGSDVRRKGCLTAEACAQSFFWEDLNGAVIPSLFGAAMDQLRLL